MTQPSPLGRQLAFYFDQQGCTACRACQIACKDLHDLPVGVNWLRVATLEFGRFPRPEVFHVVVACNHCARPACVEACPSGALTKRAEDGVVALDRSLCTKCRACEDACPYGAIQHDPATGEVGKCDLCGDFVAAGKAPACVAACTMRVLRWGWLDELDSADSAGELTDTVRGLPDPAITGPSWRIRPHRDARASAR